MKKLFITLFIGILVIFPALGFADSKKLKNQNIQDIDTYRQDVIALHESVQKNAVFSTITLKSPLQVDEIQAFVDEYKIGLRTVMLSFIDSENGLATGLGSLSATKEILEDVSEDCQEILGVYVLTGKVFTKNLKNLQADSRVFLVDIRADKSVPGNGKSFAEEMINQ